MTEPAWVPTLADLTVGALLAVAATLATGSVQVRSAASLRPRAARSPVGRSPHGLARLLSRRATRRADAGRVQVVITQVAGLVRSGMPPPLAWSSVDVATSADGTPRTDDLVRLTHDLSQAHAVVAASRLAHEVGAPVAPVLDAVVAALVASAEAAAERDTALAAPRSTARLLLWLPAVGAGLATVLGAGPVRLLLDGGPAAVAPVAGVVMLVLGRTWTRRLVRSAASTGGAG